MKHHYPDCQGGPTCNCDEREREEIEREMSDTQKTDAGQFDCQPENPMVKNGVWVVAADFARKLERERDEARQLAVSWRNRAFDTQCEAEKCPLPWEEAGDE